LTGKNLEEGAVRDCSEQLVQLFEKGGAHGLQVVGSRGGSDGVEIGIVPLVVDGLRFGETVFVLVTNALS